MKPVLNEGVLIVRDCISGKYLLSHKLNPLNDFKRTLSAVETLLNSIKKLMPVRYVLLHELSWKDPSMP